jgi:hypothetical protein
VDDQKEEPKAYLTKNQERQRMTLGSPKQRQKCCGFVWGVGVVLSSSIWKEEENQNDDGSRVKVVGLCIYMVGEDFATHS